MSASQSITAGSALGARHQRLGALSAHDLTGPARRAARLAEALFPGAAADVILLGHGRLLNPRAPGGVDVIPEPCDGAIWIDGSAGGDTTPGDSPRFRAAAPVRLSGRTLGVLVVEGDEPRRFDVALAGRLEDLATILAQDCERLLAGDLSRARDLFEAAPGFMAIAVGPDHVLDIANQAFRRFVGEHRNLVGKPVAEALPELVQQGFVQLLDEVYRTGKPFLGHGVSVRINRRPDGQGEEVFVDFVYQPVREPDGAVSGIFCQGYEVTEAKLARQALRASGRKLQVQSSAARAVMDQLRDVVCTLDSQGHFTEVSRRAEAVWGRPADSLIGMHHLDLVHPDDRAAAEAAMTSIREGAPTNAFMARAMHLDGMAVPVMWSCVWSEQHQSFFSVGRDMREHLLAEERQRHARKMEALGRLTGGVAHDFNNLLTAIVGSAELLVQGLEPKDERRELAELIVEASDRGSELVGSLLAFSRKQALNPEPLDCCALLRSLLPIVERTLPASIRVSLEYPEVQTWVKADRGQLTAALLNLCINARDAMDSGGEITLSARAEPNAERAAQVVLEVRDNGCGMPKEVLERALEPFFTTKSPGKGTGLGLSTVYGFVTQSDGRMEIQSEPGGGTSVRLYLPATATAQCTPEAVQNPSVRPECRRLLVVEDDDLVREQLDRQLTALGYQVTLAENARAALDRLAESSFDLLFTDVVMPGGMNGRQLADHARLLHPALPVLFTSGYVDDTILGDARFDETMKLLRKPYRRTELAAVLAEVLGDA